MKRRNRFERLQSGIFRWINEKLYTIESQQAVQLIQQDPSLYEQYHQGYQQSLKQWPVKPLDKICKYIRKHVREKRIKIADLGCGEALLSEMLAQDKVRVISFDLVASKPEVIACDIANLPLNNRSVRIAVFSLSLMGTNHVQFLTEAHRILRKKGLLIIAEVASRIDNIDEFVRRLLQIGFRLKTLDTSNTHFIFAVFDKVKPGKEEIKKVLNPGKYKRR